MSVKEICKGIRLRQKFRKRKRLMEVELNEDCHGREGGEVKKESAGGK